MLSNHLLYFIIIDEYIVKGQNPLAWSHSNPPVPSFNVGAIPLRRRCRILDLQFVLFSSLW